MYQYSIPLYCWRVFHCMDRHTVHLLIDIWTGPSLWLLQIQLPWTFMHKGFYRYVPSPLSGTYFRGKWPDHRVICVQLFKELPIFVFRSVHTLLCPHQHVVHKNSSCSPSSPAFGTVSDFSTSVGASWNYPVVLFCISLITNNVEHLFMCSPAILISSLV